jgi:hypothetical protein
MIKFKTVKAKFIVLMLLIGLLLAYMPSTIAQSGLFQGNIELTYNVNDVPATIRPESDIARVNLYINHFASGLGSQIVIPFFSANTVPIELTVSETPDWLTVSVAPGVVYPKLGTETGEVPENAIVSISLTPNAPAFQTESIEIVATHGNIPPIRSAINKIPIEIKSGFYSNFQYEYPTFKEIGAGETVTFPINIKGYSNARSRIIFEVVDPPDGWSTSINTEFFLGTAALNEDATGTVNFMIQSPLDFGYHNEVEQFNVRVKTMAAGHPEVGIDNTTVLQFTVRSRGFSTPGFEAALTIVTLIAVIIIYRKKQNYL